MLTTIAAGRVFDFSHVVGRGGGSGMGFSRAVSVALGAGDTVYVLNRGAEQIKDVPWNRAYVGARVGKFTIGPMPGDEEFVADFSRPGDGPGQFIWPAGLALDSQENVYVTDEDTRNVLSSAAIRIGAADELEPCEALTDSTGLARFTSAGGGADGGSGSTGCKLLTKPVTLMGACFCIASASAPSTASWMTESIVNTTF